MGRAFMVVPGVVADGTVTTPKLAAGAVTAAKVGADVATQTELDAHTGAASPHSGHLTGAGGVLKIAGGTGGPSAASGLATVTTGLTTVIAAGVIYKTGEGSNGSYYEVSSISGGDVTFHFKDNSNNNRANVDFYYVAVGT